MERDTASSSQSNIIYFLSANIILLLAYSFNDGFFFSPIEIFLVGTAILILILPLVNFRILDIYSKLISVKNLLLLGTLANFILFLAISGGVLHMISPKNAQILFTLELISFIIFPFYFAKEKSFNIKPISYILNHILKYKFAYLVTLALIMRIFIVLASPDPGIDVFNVANEQVDNLLAGRNPYSAVYTSPWLNWISSPSYLPSIILLNIPGRLFLGDVRFGYIFTHIIIALIIYYLLNKNYKEEKIITELPVLMFLYLPNSLYVLRQTWIEPLILLALSLFIFLYLKNKTSYITLAILGLFIFLKQNYFPLFFIALLNFKPKKEKIAAMLLIPILSIAPFLIWDYKSFIAATVTNIMQFGSIYSTTHSISLNTIFRKFYDQNIPFLYSFTTLLIILYLLMLKIKKDDIINFIHLSTIFLLATFIIIWGFPNYYYCVSGILVLLTVLSLLKIPYFKNDYSH